MVCLPPWSEDMVGLEAQNRRVERKFISDVAGGHKNRREEGEKEEERQREKQSTEMEMKHKISEKKKKGGAEKAAKSDVLWKEKKQKLSEVKHKKRREQSDSHRWKHILQHVSQLY